MRTGLVVIAVIKGAVLSSSHLVGVLLRENFTILDRLYSGVVVLQNHQHMLRSVRMWKVRTNILVDLTVDRNLRLIVLGPGNMLVLNRCISRLVDSGILNSCQHGSGKRSRFSSQLTSCPFLCKKP